jgi:hypothetical protein
MPTRCGWPTPSATPARTAVRPQAPGRTHAASAAVVSTDRSPRMVRLRSEPSRCRPEVLAAAVASPLSQLRCADGRTDWVVGRKYVVKERVHYSRSIRVHDYATESCAEAAL